jgi:hypothetical protein
MRCAFKSEGTHRSHHEGACDRACLLLGGVELSLFSDRVANCVQDINQFAG